jgi:hypothetical protein
MAALLITEADIAIAAAADVTVADLDGTTDPVLGIVARGLVIRNMGNPEGAVQTREQLGGYSVSRTYQGDPNGGGGALDLTDGEILLVRRAIHGTNTASPHADSLDDQIGRSIIDGRLTVYSEKLTDN